MLHAVVDRVEAFVYGVELFFLFVEVFLLGEGVDGCVFGSFGGCWGGWGGWLVELGLVG